MDSWAEGSLLECRAVVAADPERGRPAFELWLACDDADVRWVARQNLAKKRLERADPEWVAACRRAVG